MVSGGAAGTLLMGPLADRFGRRPAVAASMAVVPPLILAFTFAGAYPGMALLALVGAATMGTTGVTVVMGQEYLPGRKGLAAGVTMGLYLGLGGAGPLLLDLLADVGGLPRSMLAMATLPLSRVSSSRSPCRARGGPHDQGATEVLPELVQARG